MSYLLVLQIGIAALTGERGRAAFWESDEAGEPLLR